MPRDVVSPAIGKEAELRWRRNTRTSSEPATLMGRVIRVNVLRLDDASFRSLVDELRKQGEINSTASIEAIFPIAVRRMFFEPQHLDDIPTFVAEMRVHFGEVIEPHTTELLIRHAVGQDVSIDGLDPQVAGMARMMTFSRLADVVHGAGHDDEAFVNSVIIEAEHTLSSRGIPQARMHDS